MSRLEWRRANSATPPLIDEKRRWYDVNPVFGHSRTGRFPFLNHIKMKTRNWLHVLALGCFVIAPISNTRGAQTYQLTDLGALPGTNSYALGINNQGQVVGYFQTFGGTRAFLYNASGLYQLGTLGGTNSFANGINSFTQITGTSSTDNDGRTQAFLWQNGALLNLDSLVPAGSGWELEDARGINDRGEIAGWGTINGQQRGFLYGNGSVTSLDTLPGGTNTFALGLNNGGPQWGRSSIPNGTTHAFPWQHGAMTALNYLLPKNSAWWLPETPGLNSFGQHVA